MKILLLSSLFALVPNLHAETTLRIRLLERAKPTRITIFSEIEEAPINVGEQSFSSLALSVVGNKVKVKDGSELVSTAKEFGFDHAPARFWISGPGIPSRLYSGKLSVRVDRGKLLLVNSVKLETYLSGVLHGEAGVLKHREALMAQAVVSRSFVLAREGRHSGKGYDYCDHQHCQVYPGLDGASLNAKRAAVYTAGLVLGHGDKVVEAFYHSSCGGKTALPNEIWAGKKIEVFSSVEDKNLKDYTYCSISPDFNWKLALRSSDMTDLAVNRGWLKANDQITDVKIIERTASGRVGKIMLTGRRGKKTISGETFYLGVGRRFGWFKVRSSWFDVSRDGVSYVFTGRGGGHGVGFCQWGAEGMAQKGFKHLDILKHYFPKARLAHLER